MRFAGFVFVALGLGLLLMGGLDLGFNRQRTVLEVGGLKATATERTTIPYSPVLGVIALVGGIVLLLGAKRQGARVP